MPLITDGKKMKVINVNSLQVIIESCEGIQELHHQKIEHPEKIKEGDILVRCVCGIFVKKSDQACHRCASALLSHEDLANHG